MPLSTQEFKCVPVKCQGNPTKSWGRGVIYIPFRASSSTLSRFVPSNSGLGTARQDHIKTITPVRLLRVAHNKHTNSFSLVTVSFALVVRIFFEQSE